MRFAVSVFVGLALWSGQAISEPMGHNEATEVFFKGTSVSEWYDPKTKKWTGERFQRIVYKGELFVCRDYVTPDTFSVRYFCYDSKPTYQ